MTAAAPTHQLVRRLDWRFLLDDPTFRVVAVVGPADAELAQACAALGIAVRDAAAGVDGADVLFAGDPDRQALDLVVAARRQVGSIVFETTSRRARLAVGRRLRRSSLTVTSYGCWPDAASATRLVPLGDRGHLLASARSAKNRHRRRIGTVVSRLGLGALLFRDAVTIACDAEHVPAPRRVAGRDDVSAATTLLTPRFGSSRHVIALLGDMLGDTVGGMVGAGLVVKTSRVPGDDEQLEREAHGLASVDGPQPLRPTLVADTEWAGHRWVVQTRVDGEPLARRHVIAAPDRWLVAAERWLAELPVGASSVPDEDGRIERLVTPALVLLAACADADPALRPLVADAERAVERVRRTPLPVVAEHGDFRPPNLVIVGADSIGAVDWELAERAGLPMHDLVFFHAFVADVVPELRAALDAMGRSATQAMGIDAELFESLRSVALLRQVAHLGRRGTGAGDTVSARVADSDVVRGWFAVLDSGLDVGRDGGSGDARAASPAGDR